MFLLKLVLTQCKLVLKILNTYNNTFGMADERICPPVTTQAHPAGLVHVTPNNSPPVQKVFTITFKTF